MNLPFAIASLGSGSAPFWYWDIGVALSTLGIALGAVGALLAGLAYRAADRASSAATATATKLSERTTLTDLVAANRLVAEIQVALQGDQLETAMIRVGELRIALVALRGRPGFFGEKLQLKQVQSVVTQLATMESTLRSAVKLREHLEDEKGYHEALGKIQIILTEWSEQRRFTVESHAL